MLSLWGLRTGRSYDRSCRFEMASSGKHLLWSIDNEHLLFIVKCFPSLSLHQPGCAGVADESVDALVSSWPQDKRVGTLTKDADLVTLHRIMSIANMACTGPKESSPTIITSCHPLVKCLQDYGVLLVFSPRKHLHNPPAKNATEQS